MKETVAYGISLILFFMGVIGLFGLMEGRVDFFIGGLFLLYGAIRVGEVTSWYVRTRDYPEYEITSEWDDELAEDVYTLYYFGRGVESGDLKWAKKTAQHYNITLSKSKENV